MPTLTNTIVNAAGQPVAGAAVTIELKGTWSADGAKETGALWSGTTDVNGTWSVSVPAQSAYEGTSYYLVREPTAAWACTVADSPSSQPLRSRVTSPLPVTGTIPAATLDATGRIPLSQIPVAALSAVLFVPQPTGVAATDRANIITTIANAPPGSVVQLQAGTYLTDQTITVPDHLSLVGTATQERVSFGSILRAADGSNLDAVIADAAWFTSAASVGDYKRLANLQVDGNGANQTGGMGIGVVGMSFRFHVDSVTTANTRGDGIRLTNVNRGGTEVAGTAVENKISDCHVINPGLGNLANNADGIAVREGVIGFSVTDGWIDNCVIYSETGSTNGSGIVFPSQAAGWLIRGNHIYSVGKDGIFLINTNFTRLLDNYVELWGQKPGVGAVRGVYAKDAGANGAVIANNAVNLNQGIAGNTFTGMWLENNNNAAAYYSLGPNQFYSATPSSGTGLRIVNNGSNGNFVVAYCAQTYNGMATHALIDSYCDLTGDLGGYQNPAFASTFAPDPSLGTRIEMTLTGDVTIALPTMYPRGMRLTFVFLQDATGGLAVTFASSQYRVAGWTPVTTANKANVITFDSDGFWLYQVAAAVGL